MEKMIFGMYMGEIVWLVLERFVMDEFLFFGIDKESEFFIWGRFYMKYVLEVER